MNPFNPNKAQASPLGRKSCNPIQSSNISAEGVKSIIFRGLRPDNSAELNITLLELLFLGVDQKNWLEIDELQVITVSLIGCLCDETTNSQELRKSNIKI